MNIDPIIDSYKQSSQTRVGTKNTTDSISPTDVAGCDQDLAEILRTVGNAVNNFDLLGNTLPPLNSAGVDDDIYIQGGTTLRFYKKISGVWTLKVSVPLGVTIQDGNINLQPRVSGFTITVPPGQWGINNQIYTKAAQDQFTINAADANLDRIDAVFAKTDSTVEYVAGTASANPDTTKPITPVDEIIVTYIYVPSVASGGLPYINDSNSSPTSNPLVLTGGITAPTGGNDGDVYIQNDGSVVTFYQKVTGTWTAIQNFIIGGGGSFDIVAYWTSRPTYETYAALYTAINASQIGLNGLYKTGDGTHRSVNEDDINNALDKFIGKNIKSYGDSITFGQGASESYPQKIANTLGTTLDNYAVAGSGHYFQNVKSYYKEYDFNKETDFLIWMFGINSIRIGVNDANIDYYQNYYSTALSNQITLFIVRHFKNSISKATIENGTVGTWTYENYDVPTDNNSDLYKNNVHTPFESGNSVLSFGVNNEYEFTINGTNFFISFLGNQSFSRHYPDVDVYVDNVLIERVYISQSSFTINEFTSSYVYFKKGLSAGSHTVKIITRGSIRGGLEETNDGYYLIDCHGTLDINSLTPLVIYDILDVFGSGHIDPSLYANKGLWETYRDNINDAVFDAANLFYQGTGKLKRISSELLSEDFSDGLHPNDQGVLKLYNDFFN